MEQEVKQFQVKGINSWRLTVKAFANARGGRAGHISVANTVLRSESAMIVSPLDLIEFGEACAVIGRELIIKKGVEP